MKNEILIAEWLKYAISDFELAKKGKLSKKIHYGTLCFHAQQAAEKSIKVALIFYGIKYPKTHNIEHLLKLLKENGLAVPKIISKAQLLTEYAVDSRYPDDFFFEIDNKEYKEAVGLAEKVIKWVSIIIYKDADKLF